MLGPVGECLNLARMCTKPKTKSQRQGAQIPDDVRRHWEICAWVYSYMERWDPWLVVIEWYAPRKGMRARSGWKTIITVGGILAIAQTQGRQVAAQSAGALRRFCDDAPEKEGVIAFCHDHCPGFSAHLTNHPKSKHEHVADACGHAMLARERYR